MSKLIAHIRARTVVQKAASLLDLDEMDITGDDRDPVLCEVRYAVMRVLADDGYGPSLIGRMLLRDHSTVRNGLRRADDLMKNSLFAGVVEARSEEHTSELQSLTRI